MNRKEALLKGLKVYTGRACKHCGSKIKYVSSFGCKDCNIKRNVHKLYDDKLMAPYKTKEKQIKRLNNWRKNNPEKVKEQRNRIDPGLRRFYSALYNLKKRKQTPANANLKKIENIYKKAHKLSEDMGIPYEVDHIIPVSKGGLHHQDNLQIITRSENRKKSNKINYENCSTK